MQKEPTPHGHADATQEEMRLGPVGVVRGGVSDEGDAAPSYDRWTFEKAIRAADLSMAAKCTAYALATRARRKSGVWVMIAATLGKEIGAHRATVFRALKELEAAGLLIRIRRSGQRGRRANAYQLVNPATSQSATLGKSQSATLQPSQSATPYQPHYQGLSSVQKAAAQSAGLSAHRETPRPGPAGAVPR